MKKTFLLVLMLLVAVFVFGADKYADFKAVLRDLMDVIEEFVQDLNAATTATEVADAIKTYAKNVEPLQPRMEEMDGKYPDITDTEFPPELAEIMKEYSQTTEQMSEAMGVLMQYIMEPEVQEAMQLMN